MMRKKYGQNFLVDGHVLAKIIDAAELTKDDCVLEIGPGIGTLTQYLAEHAGKVVAVEIDKDLMPILKDTLSVYDNVSLINADILKVNLDALIETENAGAPMKVVANLPYYVTTPILLELLRHHALFTDFVLMVQLEVAQRMQAGPGTKAYGALSLAVQYHAQPEIIATVPPTCFQPKPGVDSALIRLKSYPEPPVCAADEKFLFAVIRAAFNERRKTLANGLSNAHALGLSKAQIQQVLNDMGLSENVRGETFTLERFNELSNRLFARLHPSVVSGQDTIS